MKITQIRNATLIIEVTDKYILLDPMLAKKSALPRLRYYKNQQRNPLVELPNAFHQLENKIEYALITHCQKGHFDHLDLAGERWLRKNKVTTFCTKHDSLYLNKKGINIEVLKEKCSPFFNGTIEQVTAKHTTGWLTPFMEHGVGYFIKLEDEPTIYLMGDTILTDEIREFIKQNQPNYIVAPTGKAQLDIGAPLLLSEKDIIELASLSTGIIIANHMEALDHCRINRTGLNTLLSQHNLLTRFIIPNDGETLVLNE
ncbi:MBL fold metallo-hydrolase [Pseudoalteromonas haloplanktis]|uniref:MBL fold metallo-hydrolase n=1 Tax=Pseudoalteromonas haloplanktis TaxID=228 RepID=A0ABU1BAX9_PSEHA|nr:MBL fold metallo-hydrolase [Pseudoalteromonas haloplanktis]MDQ9090762.1 MBL fold metallo-hydrolase [Pseudoalteromonas haloplanktis]